MASLFINPKPTFIHSFTVNAPLAAVSAFHHDTSVLKKLTPPPLFVQIHRYEPLAEGSEAEFTLWFGLLPLRWLAVHSDVSATGFTDTQVSGPLRSWQHTHRFSPLGNGKTLISDHVEYAHHSGWRGFLSRLLFSWPGLYLLFTARKWLTRWRLRR